MNSKLGNEVENGEVANNEQATLRDLMELLVSAAKGFDGMAKRIAASDEAKALHSSMQKNAKAIEEFLAREDVKSFIRLLNEMPARMEDIDRMTAATPLRQQVTLQDIEVNVTVTFNADGECHNEITVTGDSDDRIKDGDILDAVDVIEEAVRRRIA